MTLYVFGVIMLGAALHAVWNAVVKGGGDKLLTTCLITFIAAAIALVTLPFMAPPARQSWPYLGASVLLQVLYFVLVAKTYRITDMSQAYPIMRGTAPLLVASASIVLFAEPLSVLAWTGIAVICAGILSMAATPLAGERKGLILAVVNGCVIAGYTLVDGLGVRQSGAPVAYTLWIFLLTAVPLVAWALLTQTQAFCSYIALNWKLGLIGGFGTIASYGLALWAMTEAPVAMVSALRETSILFGVAISALILKEHLTRIRILAACVIAGGAMMLRMG